MLKKNFDILVLTSFDVLNNYFDNPIKLFLDVTYLIKFLDTLAKFLLDTLEKFLFLCRNNEKGEKDNRLIIRYYNYVSQLPKQIIFIFYEINLESFYNSM